MLNTWCSACSTATDQEQSLMILEKLLPEQYSHTVCRYESTGDNSFKAAIKLKLSSEEEAKRWLEDFQSSSGFTWRTSKTYPNVGRYNKYRVDYMCRTIKRSTSCPATLFLILKRQPECGERKSRSGDPHMKEGLFFHINLRNEHDHHVSRAEAVARREVSGETIEKLKRLFESGRTPSSALKTLKLNLQEEEQDNYENAVADRSVCPDLPFCYRLYYKLFKKAYDAAAGEEVFKDLEQTLDDYNRVQGDVCARMCKTTDSQLVIAVCTPVMRRVHARLRESCEMVSVDSSGHCGSLNHHIFLLLTHSSAGCLPLGVFITTSETQATISVALELLQTVFPPDRFFGHPEGPLVVLTDDRTALKQALNEAFPKSTLVLSGIRLLQGMWRFLWTSSNEVPEQHRAHLLKSFRDLVYAPTPTALMEGYIRLTENNTALQIPKFVQHLQEVFKRREEWAICLQAQLLTRGNHISDYMQSAMSTVKEKVLHRLKSYNVTQLVNFVVTKMEAYYVRRLTDASSNRLQTSLKKVLKVKDVGRHVVVQEDQDNYTVTSSSNAAVAHHVDTAIGCCTCPAGITGGHCKHQSAVSRMYGHIDSILLWSSADTRKLFYQIATGKDIPEDASGGVQTLMLETPSLSQGAEEVCTNEAYCCPDADAESMHEPVELSLIQVETDSGEPHLKERLNTVFLDITQKLDNPNFTQSITSFVKTYESIRTDGAMVSALSSFGKSVQTKARLRKRPRGAMKNSTRNVSKRKTLAEERVPSSGQPQNVSVSEDVYGQSAEFQSIVHCVEETLCLEGTHEEVLSPP